MPDEKAVTSRGPSTTFKPIEPSDDDKNPTLVAVPKTPEAVAAEGTALSEAGSADTGGNVPVVTDSSQPGRAKRLWTLDADHNVSLRSQPLAATPDLVEFGG